MNKLPPEARRLLESAQERHIPSAREREQIRTALLGTLGAGAFADLSDGSAGFEPNAGTDLGAELAASSPSAGTLGMGAGAAVKSAELAGTFARSTLLTWRIGKLVLVGAAASTALVLSVATPRTPPRPPAPTSERAAAATPRAAALEPPQAQDELAAPPQPTTASSATDAEPAGERAFATTHGRAVARRAPGGPRARGPSIGAHLTARPAVAGRVAHQDAADPEATEGAEPTAAPPSASGLAGAATSDEASTQPAAPAPARTTPAPPAPPSTDVEDVALLRRAIASLRDHMAATALAQLEEHARRYPTSVLADERSGLQIVALCEVGRVTDGVRRQAAFFARAGSSSPLAVRVRRACSQSEP